MASLLAFLFPERIRKVGILAGFVPGGLEELVTQRPLEGKPFFIAHGTKDETVSIQRARGSSLWMTTLLPLELTRVHLM